MAALFGTALLGGGLDRRLDNLAGAVLLRPAIEKRLHDLTDLAGVVDIADRQHAGNKQRVDVLFMQFDAD
jgi:predicted DNA-binding protein